MTTWEPVRGYAWLEVRTRDLLSYKELRVSSLDSLKLVKPLNFVFQLFNPTEILADIVIEREYVECTSSVIQALVMFKQLYSDHRTREIDRTIEKAVQFIESKQETDGSWYCVH